MTKEELMEQMRLHLTDENYSKRWYEEFKRLSQTWAEEKGYAFIDEEEEE